MTRLRSRVAVLAAGLITGSLTGCTVPGAEGAGSDDDDPATSTSTSTVQRTDLTETLTESGQLEYGDPLDIGAVLTGTVTWAPAAGSVVTEGERLYRLDSDPVLRLDGTVPAWRDLGPT